MLFSIVPLAQTPWDKRHASSQRNHSGRVQKAIESIAPWQYSGRARSKLAHLRDKVKPGEVVVVLDAGDQANLSLYEDAKIMRE